jgi:hypothetical protein
MTLYDFIQLGLAEKLNRIWQGSFLSARDGKNETVILYRLYDFFCEVYFENEKNSIVRLRPFRAKEMLQDFFEYQLN